MKLTTITPYWNRPEMLRAWIRNVRLNAHLEVRHLLIAPDQKIKKDPDLQEAVNAGIEVLTPSSEFGPHSNTWRRSIGHWHNLGAKHCGTPWMMKLDVDCFHHRFFWTHLLDVVNEAAPRQWFNVGMFMTDRARPFPVPLGYGDYLAVSSMLFASGKRPVSSQFVCRVQDYKDAGMCSEEFRGYGWEDYYQLYALQRQFLDRDPLPGSIENGCVTSRCRDEISRPMAAQLYHKSKSLALFHHWHEGTAHDSSYKSAEIINHNRRILYDIITASRKSGTEPVS